ncbi:MAG: glycosyltransferase family 39 protein [bacterium]|nr:glycosyltransferase family 39 protein [bacterium]
MKPNAFLLAFAFAKLAIHLFTLRGYGYFRDELYYLACSDHLAWGYVDQPPLSISLLRASRAVLGDSVWAIRILPALAGAAMVFLVGWMARELGGGRFAQALAMCGAIVAPVYLALDHFYSMNSLELLFWALAAAILIRILNGGDDRLWLLLGVVLGLGLLNKISVLWLGFGLGVGLVLTPARRYLLTRWPYLAAAIAALLFLPHVLWQIAHDWPTLEFIDNATGSKMARSSPIDFALGQINNMNPFTLPLWLAGLGFLFGHRKARSHRLLGWIYLTVFALLVLSQTSRAGYLSPAYTFLFAAGGVALERQLKSPRWRLPGYAYLALMLVAGALIAPLALPSLPVETYISWARTMGQEPATEERKEVAELGQFYADMHGWEEIVETVADVHGRLPAEDRAKAGIFVYNYGEAGAIDHLGKRHGLPPATSGHNNYWLWGPRGMSGEVVIVIGGSEEGHLRRYADVERAGTTDCGYCMPYENNQPIFVLRGPIESVADIWPDLKHFD